MPGRVIKKRGSSRGQKPVGESGGWSAAIRKQGETSDAREAERIATLRKNADNAIATIWT